MDRDMYEKVYRSTKEVVDDDLGGGIRNLLRPAIISCLSNLKIEFDGN